MSPVVVIVPLAVVVPVIVALFNVNAVIVVTVAPDVIAVEPSVGAE
jgi:hypothetical protein